MVDENPELALMGSCVLGMLMKGEDVYLMNVGDSRAVLAQKKEPDLRLGKVDHDLERINEESMYDFEVSDGVKASLRTFQLTLDHCTCVEEVKGIIFLLFYICLLLHLFHWFRIIIDYCKMALRSCWHLSYF